MTPYPDSTLPSVRLTSGTECLNGIRRHMSRLMEPAGLDVAARTLVLLAVEETAANILEHGYDRRPGRPLRLTVGYPEKGRFVVTLQDRAPRFEWPDVVPTLEALAASRAKRGRGWNLVRSIVDSVEHRPREAEGNTWILTFSRQRLYRCAKENSREAA